METLIKKDWNYTLARLSDNLVLKVLCGTIGLFEISILLSSEEKKEFEMHGELFIDEFANKVRNDPENYMTRNIA